MWDMIIPAATSLVTSALSSEGANERNEAQIAQSQRQMDFQERMSNTSYQRAVQDLASAGLNPMLAYAHGGASTPAGSQANIEDAITPAIQTGQQAYRAVTEAGLRKAQVADIEASAGLKTAQQSESAAKTQQSIAEADKARSEAALNIQNIDKSKQDVLHSAASVELMHVQGEQIYASIEKIAPEIKLMVSQMHLNEASRRKVLSELPLIAAQIPRVRAETEESYQRRLLLGVQTRLESLKQNEGEAFSGYYGSSYGKASPYIHSGAQATGEVLGSISPWAWLLRGGGGSSKLPNAGSKIPTMDRKDYLPKRGKK